MSFWDEIRDKASWAATRVGEKLGEVKDKTATELTVLRIKRQIAAAEEAANELYRQLGRRAFELAEQGKIQDAECRGLAEEIRAKRDLVAGYEEDIARARKDAEEAGGKPAESPKDGAPEAGGEDAAWEDEGTPPRS